MKKTDIGWTAYEFVLERFGVRIVADCPESRCSHWVNSVGKVVEGDKGTAGLISYHDRRCKDEDSLRHLADGLKAQGRNVSVWEACQDEIMLVQKMEAMSQSR